MNNKNNQANVVILMATYNGEKFLKEQIDSILDQSFDDFLLVIRDDNSNDHTVEILENYNDDRIIILRNRLKEHGQLSNFAYLFKYAISNLKFNYLMFADQDDIWLRNKIGKSLQEFNFNDNAPILVYTNYYVFNMKSGKCWKAFKGEIPANFENIFVQNWLLGCTMMLNRAMVHKIKEIPQNVENHDYWISLVASLHDEIFFSNTPTMIHRLHSGNVTVQQSANSLSGRINSVKKILMNKEEKYKSWIVIYSNLEKMFPHDNKINELKNILFNNRLVRVWMANKYGFKGLSNKSTALFDILLFLLN